MYVLMTTWITVIAENPNQDLLIGQSMTWGLTLKEVSWLEIDGEILKPDSR